MKQTRTAASLPRLALVAATLLIASGSAFAADGASAAPAVFGIPVDFILFALTLLGVALFHNHTLRVGLTGLAVITAYKLLFTGFKTGPGIHGSDLPFRPRVGDPHQPALPAARFRAAVAAFREDATSRRCCRASCRTTGRAPSSCW